MFRGDRLKQLRESRGYTHDDLSQLLDVGYAQIYRFENGHEPKANLVAEMAVLFNVSSDYLLGLSDDPNPIPTSSNLSDHESAILEALRRGDEITAIREIVKRPVA